MTSTGTTQTRTSDPHRAFNVAMIVSGIRCTLTYVILPFVVPLIGLAPSVGPSIGIVTSVVAIIANVVSLRRFWAVQHRLRVPMTVIHIGVIGLVTALLVLDIAELL